MCLYYFSSGSETTECWKETTKAKIASVCHRWRISHRYYLMCLCVDGVTGQFFICFIFGSLIDISCDTLWLTSQVLIGISLHAPSQMWPLGIWHAASHFYFFGAIVGCISYFVRFGSTSTNYQSKAWRFLWFNQNLSVHFLTFQPWIRYKSCICGYDQRCDFSFYKLWHVLAKAPKSEANSRKIQEYFKVSYLMMMLQLVLFLTREVFY